MGARVSVTVTSSHAGSATARPGDSAAAGRDPAVGAAPANGFSSAMNAAARPATHAPGSDTHSDAAAAGSSPASAKPVSTASKATPTTSTATSTGTSAVLLQTAAATVIEAEDSSVDADLTTPEDQPAAKGGGKSRVQNEDSSAAPTDPTALALLFAASGMQIDPRTGTGQQSTDGNAKTSDQAATAAAGAGVAAVLATAVSTVQLPPSTAAATVGTSQTSPGTAGTAAPADATVMASFATTTPAIHLDVDAPNVTGASDDSLSGTALAPNRSAAPDGIQPAPTPTGPTGVSEMIRGLSGSAPTAAVERTVSVPVSDRNWSAAVAGQVQWMVNSNVQSATLQLSPEHLGPLEVRIDIQTSQVNVSFTASHPETRSALEQGVPQLRAILANGGLTLGQATVQQEARSGSHYTATGSRHTLGAAESVDSVSVSSVRSLGLIDEYV